jgi:hypothetical protein
MIELLEYFVCYMCLVRCSIEATLDHPRSTEELYKCIRDDVLHLVSIDSCVVPVLREEEDQRGIMLFESGGFQIDDECCLRGLQSFQETNIRERRVRLF